VNQIKPAQDDARWCRCAVIGMKIDSAERRFGGRFNTLRSRGVGAAPIRCGFCK
jgi:hypothetical protein